MTLVIQPYYSSMYPYWNIGDKVNLTTYYTFIYANYCNIYSCLSTLKMHLISMGGAISVVIDFNYPWNQCLSPLTLWVRIPSRWGVLKTTLCDKVCQGLAAGQWFPQGTPDSSTNKADSLNITKILLKVALNPITLTLTPYIIGSRITIKYEWHPCHNAII